MEPLRQVLRQHARTIAVFCAVTIIVLGAGVGIAARTLLARFQDLEDAAGRQRADQVYQAFETDLKQLQISNRDYAEWDDAQTFMQTTRDPEFLTHNFSTATLLGMHVDFVWITDAAGREVFSRLVKRDGGEAETPAPVALRQILSRFQYADSTLTATPPAERLVRTPDGLVAALAFEIKRSDGSEPTGGVMQFARFIGDDEVARVNETSRMPVKIIALAGRSGEGGALPADVADWSANAAAGAGYVRIKDSEEMSSYALLRGVDGAPLAVLATDAPRSIHLAGVRTTTWLLGSIVLLFVVFGVTVFALVLRMLTIQQSHIDGQRAAEEQQRANRRNLVKQAQRDFLTGLPNRLFVHARVPRLIQRVIDSDVSLALIHLDVDHFKNINDSRGHGTGDQLLRVIAKRLRAAVSGVDLVARMGGDEFVIVASLMPNVEAIERLAQRIQLAVAKEVVLDKKPLSVTASMGIAVFPRDGADVDTLLKHADIALFQAKEAGRRTHRFFVTDMNDRISEHVSLEQELRRAVGTPQIYLDYQPIIDFATGRVVSLEALMRWRHPEMGSIPPGRFIPVAEKTGLIVELGQQALEAVLAQQRAWLEDGVPVVPIAVNVSPLQVERQDFADVVAKLVKSVGLEPKWVRFEITESAMTKEPEKLIGTLRKLRAMGSQVLIDDFGTGYSSLSYIDRMPIDIIKIDRAFVTDLGRAERESPVIPAVVELARQLRLKTVAEGVETAAQAAALAALGCDYGQGYFYSKPVQAHHCRSLLEHLQRERALSETLIARVVRA
jgi:diguanylate cyclase (GGDEF)-like protein